MKRLIITAASMLLLTTIAVAQVLRLDEVIDSIQVRNPIVGMYENEIRSMEEAAKGARSWMPPQLGIGQFMTPYDVSRWRKEGDMPGMGSVMLSAEQMFPNRKKLDADEAYMRAMSSVEKENKNASLNELIADARQFYYDWILLKKNLRVLEENDRILDFMIQNAEIRYRNGLEKISAYYKAKAALAEVKNRQLMYENEIRQRMIRLNSLMGREALTEFDIDTSYQLKNFDDLVFDSTLFYAQRSDLRSIDREIDLTQLKRESERAALKPQFGIRYENMIGFGGQPLQYNLMAMIRIPMAGWSSRMNKANMESLRWKATALESKKKMLVNEYSGMAYGMRSELRLKASQLKLYEQEIIPALRKNYQSMQLAYEQNTQELFMLYDAWEVLNNKQLEYISLLADALSLQVAIERLIETK
jgi:outer membrane protein TolC